jgi:hypothetical protein
LASLAIAAAGVFSVAQAQQKAGEKWVLLGAPEIDFARGSQTVDLSKAKGAYKGIRLIARRGNVQVSHVEVKYLTGSAHNERRNIDLKQGEHTKPINPTTEDRFLDSVIISYKADPAAKRKGQVQVYGLQSSAGLAAKRPASGAIAGQDTSGKATEKPGSVTAGGDVLFGAQLVGFGVDRDTIRVGSEIGKFNRLRLRVLDNDIFISELRVNYLSGDPDVLAVNAEIKQNTRTRWFDLKSDRFIKDIQMTYRSRPNFKGQARIEAYGEYAANWLGPNGEGRKYNQGWVLLGAQTAGFVGFDNDLVPVGVNEGGFKRLRVAVKDRAITLNELRVIYVSGKDDVIPVKSKVEAGTIYGPVDLAGSARAIKEVRAKYRSRFFDSTAVGKGAAVVEIWGQH